MSSGELNWSSRREARPWRGSAPVAVPDGADAGAQDGKETISSQELADFTHVNSTQIRRDLSGFGSSASGAWGTTSTR